MSISPARSIAYQILDRVEAGRGFAVDLLQSAEVAGMKEVDRRLATELVMGVLRWQGGLDEQIEQLSGKSLKKLDSEVANILRLGIFQIQFLEKIPKNAVVNESVELTKRARKRSATGFVNAILHKCEPPVRRLPGLSFEELSAEERDSVRRAVPGWMFERWASRPWPETGEAGDSASEIALRLAYSSTRVPATSLRVTDHAAGVRDVERVLVEDGVTVVPGRIVPRSLMVVKGNVQASRAFREGRVVIQDEASQIVGDLLAPHPGERLLDLCAAPGIKTRQLADALVRGTLVACDLSATRLRTLVRLLARSVPSDVRLEIVRLNAVRDLPFNVRFDRILVDVPCSGTGTLARNPEIKLRLQPNDLTRLANAQSAILRSALEVLTPGGRLVYSTCSLEPEENECVVEKVLEETPDFRLLGQDELAREFPQFANQFDSRGFFRTRPDLHFVDGFFAAAITSKG